MQLLKLIFQFFYFLGLLHVSNLTVNLQEEAGIYTYGIVCFMCISISSLVGSRVCSIEQSVSKHVQGIKFKNWNINFKKVYFVGLYWIISNKYCLFHGHLIKKCLHDDKECLIRYAPLTHACLYRAYRCILTTK
jgi:hypothetical protein